MEEGGGKGEDETERGGENPGRDGEGGVNVKGELLGKRRRGGGRGGG